MKEYPFPTTTSSESSALKTIPFFQTVSSADLKRLLEHTTIIECDPGERIMIEGEKDPFLYFLLRGKLRVMKEGTSVGSSWESGEMFGEMALLHDTARTATLVAEAHSYCLKVDPTFIQDLSDEEKATYQVALYRCVANLATERLASTTHLLARCEKQLEEYRHKLAKLE